jgi:hypothetical protein
VKRPLVPPAVALILRLAIVAALLAWIATRVDFVAFGRTLAAADRRFLAAAGCAILLGHVSASLRWHRLLRAAGSTWRFARTVAVYAAGIFLGLFIPTGVGGDVYRLARVGGSGAGLARGGATILIERAVGLLALLLVGTGFVFAQAGTRPWGVPLVLGAIAGIAGLVALSVPGGPERLARLLDGLPGPGPSLAARVRDGFPREIMDRLRGALPGTLLLSMLNHVLLIIVAVLLARGLGLTAPWPAIAAAVPLVLLASQVPITPGGIGVREAGFVYFLGRVGIAEEPALALALGWAALLYLIGLLAALGLLGDRDAAPAPSPQR